MAFYRCGGGGIPSSLKTDMNAVLNKKFGTSADYPPADWAPTVNLMGPLPEKTIVSSPIADFSDGADDVPTKSLVVTIPPTLSGKSEVVCTQINSDNLFLLPSNDFSVSGVDFKIGSDSLTIDGTSTANISSKDNIFKTYFSFGLPKGTYYFTRGTWTKATYVYKLADDSTALVTNSGSFTLTDYTEIYIGFYIGTGQTVSEVTFDGYLKQGSSASSYSPQPHPTQYTASLGRTINGGEVYIVNGVGQETSIMIDLSTIPASAWNMDGTTRFRTRMTAYRKDAGWSGDWQNTLCHALTPENPATSFAKRSDYSFANIPQNYYNFDIKVPANTFANGTEFQAWLANYDGNGTHALLVIDRATPEPFTFDGQEVPTRLGYNAFWSDSGDTEVRYRADINLALGGQ